MKGVFPTLAKNASGAVSLGNSANQRLGHLFQLDSDFRLAFNHVQAHTFYPRMFFNAVSQSARVGRNPELGVLRLLNCIKSLRLGNGRLSNVADQFRSLGEQS